LRYFGSAVKVEIADGDRGTGARQAAGDSLAYAGGRARDDGRLAGQFEEHSTFLPSSDDERAALPVADYSSSGSRDLAKERRVLLSQKAFASIRYKFRLSQTGLTLFSLVSRFGKQSFFASSLMYTLSLVGQLSSLVPLGRSLI